MSLDWFKGEITLFDGEDMGKPSFPVDDVDFNKFECNMDSSENGGYARMALH